MMTTENLNAIPKEVLDELKSDNFLPEAYRINREEIIREKEKMTQQLLKNQEERLEILAKQYEALKQELEIKSTLENIVANQEKKEDNKILLNE